MQKKASMEYKTLTFPTILLVNSKLLRPLTWRYSVCGDFRQYVDFAEISSERDYGFKQRGLKGVHFQIERGINGARAALVAFSPKQMTASKRNPSSQDTKGQACSCR